MYTTAVGALPSCSFWPMRAASPRLGRLLGGDNPRVATGEARTALYQATVVYSSVLTVPTYCNVACTV